jgi:molybdopterin converting factor small subunit
VGVARVALDIDQGSTMASVFDQLVRDHPRLAGMRANLRCAVEQEYAGWDTAVTDQAEVAFIPPTAGG